MTSQARRCRARLRQERRPVRNVADVAAWQKANRGDRTPDPLRAVLVPGPGTRGGLEEYSNGCASTHRRSSATATPWSAWENSVDDRFDDAPAWSRQAGPGGWNDLDSLDVGNGAMDGLTKAERQTYATLWAISKSPLYTGDTLTRLDSYGLSLLTNREVIAVDQKPRRPLVPSPGRRPAGVGGRERRRQLHRRPVQPADGARRRHPATGRPSASPARPRSATCGT